MSQDDKYEERKECVARLAKKVSFWRLFYSSSGFSLRSEDWDFSDVSHTAATTHNVLRLYREGEGLYHETNGFADPNADRTPRVLSVYRRPREAFKQYLRDHVVRPRKMDSDTDTFFDHALALCRNGQPVVVKDLATGQSYSITSSTSFAMSYPQIYLWEDYETLLKFAGMTQSAPLGFFASELSRRNNDLREEEPYKSSMKRSIIFPPEVFNVETTRLDIDAINTRAATYLKHVNGVDTIDHIDNFFLIGKEHRYDKATDTYLANEHYQLFYIERQRQRHSHDSTHPDPLPLRGVYDSKYDTKTKFPPTRRFDTSDIFWQWFQYAELLESGRGYDSEPVLNVEPMVQQEDSDCGIFAVMYADALSLGFLPEGIPLKDAATDHVEQRTFIARKRRWMTLQLMVRYLL